MRFFWPGFKMSSPLYVSDRVDKNKAVRVDVLHRNLSVLFQASRVDNSQVIVDITGGNPVSISYEKCYILYL